MSLMPRLVMQASILSFAAVLAGSDRPAPAGAPVSLPIANHSFEAPAYQTCSFGFAQNWLVIGGGGGAWHPGTAMQCGTFFGGPVPDGSQIGFVNNSNSYLGQTLSAVLQPFSKYQLLVEVGRRADGFGTGTYRVELRAGGVVLVEDPGVLDLPPGTFQTSSICVETGASHAAMGQPLEIRLYQLNGVQRNFDDVRLFKSDPDGQCDVISGNPADLNGDGTVNGSDLGLLLGAWGPCANCASCPADLDGNCVVDGGDLGLLLGSWG